MKISNKTFNTMTTSNYITQVLHHNLNLAVSYK